MFKHEQFIQLAEYFEPEVSQVLKRKDIPDNLKSGLLKKVMMNEPWSHIFDSPLYYFYNIHNKRKRKFTLRKSRRFRRPNQASNANDAVSFSFQVNSEHVEHSDQDSLNQSPEM